MNRRYQTMKFYHAVERMGNRVWTVVQWVAIVYVLYMAGTQFMVGTGLLP